MTKRASDTADTIWTAPASREVPVLSQLDMDAPPNKDPRAKARAENARAKAEAKQAFFAPRPLSASLRKLIK